jgi:ABC-2 type transport system permease protein
MAMLRTGEICAILAREREGGARIVVGENDALMGAGLARGLANAFAEEPFVEIVRKPRWSYIHYLFPGLLTFVVLLSGLFGMGYFMVRHRQNLFLKKLATTPLPRATFVGAQICARSLLVLGQAAVLVTVARVAFDVPLSGVAAAWVALFTLLGIVTFMGAGFALACAVRTEATMVDVINSITTPLVLLSEIFFPLDELPRPIAAVGGALPSTQMVRLVRAVMLHGTPDPKALLPGIGIMLAWIVVTYAVSVLTFRWHA